MNQRTGTHPTPGDSSSFGAGFAAGYAAAKSDLRLAFRQAIEAWSDSETDNRSLSEVNEHALRRFLNGIDT